MALVAGKGFMGDATEGSIDFLTLALSEVQEVFQSMFEIDGEEVSADSLIDMKKTGKILSRMATVEGWETTKDDFGDKVFKCIPWGNSQYQVTLVRMKRDGQLKIDVRSWFEPNQAASGSRYTR